MLLVVLSNFCEIYDQFLSENRFYIKCLDGVISDFFFCAQNVLFLNAYICPFCRFYEPINCWIIYHVSVFQMLQCPLSQSTSRWGTESMWSSCVRLEEGLLRALSSCQWTMNRTTPWRTQHALHMKCVCLTSLWGLLFLWHVYMRSLPLEMTVICWVKPTVSLIKYWFLWKITQKLW